MDKRIKDSNKIYLLRLQLFSTYLSLSCPENYGLLEKVEKELYQIQDSKLHGGIYGIVKFLLYNICSFHYCSSRFTYNAIIKNYNEIQAELIENNLAGIYQFLKWLIDDMEKGSALL
ncbi:MAG: hypothetical protein JEY91_15095 [Spirochaetaceae bacterium]|nr:hypothetical protein [Spirochaetaceae bacterium]